MLDGAVIVALYTGQVEEGGTRTPRLSAGQGEALSDFLLDVFSGPLISTIEVLLQDGRVVLPSVIAAFENKLHKHLELGPRVTRVVNMSLRL